MAEGIADPSKRRKMIVKIHALNGEPFHAPDYDLVLSENGQAEYAEMRERRVRYAATWEWIEDGQVRVVIGSGPVPSSRKQLNLFWTGEYLFFYLTEDLIPMPLRRGGVDSQGE